MKWLQEDNPILYTKSLATIIGKLYMIKYYKTIYNDNQSSCIVSKWDKIRTFYNGPKIQGSRVTKAWAYKSPYNPQALHHWFIITNSSKHSVNYGKSGVLNSK